MNKCLPKSFMELLHDSTKAFVSDAVAGISVALVALPLAMAIAIASGVPPQMGLYCAVVTGFLLSILGGSSAQISGPAAAFIVLAYGIVTQYGLDGLSICTLMAGVILVILGVTGLGAAVKFIPPPVVVGFKNGIAVVIIGAQLKDFFGVKVANGSGEFWARLEVVAKHFRTFSAAETSLGAVTLLLIFILTHHLRRVPAYGVALFASTALTTIFKLPVETIATRFGGIPSGLPGINILHLRPDLIPSLVSPAIAIATLSAILSLPSPTNSGQMTGNKRDSNLKLVRQGIANTVSALFCGLPVTGTMVGTDTNIRLSTPTRVASVFQTLALFLFVLFAAPLASFIPLCVLAAILSAAALRMGEWHEIPKLLKLSRLEIGVWMTTCLLTIFADLTVAVEGGMILALLMFIRKVTATPVVTVVRERHIEEGRAIQ